MRRFSASRRVCTVATTPFFTITRSGPSLWYGSSESGDAFHLTVQHSAFPRAISAADDVTYAQLKPPAAGLLARIPIEKLQKDQVWNPIRLALSEFSGAHRYPAAAMYSNEGVWVTEYGHIKGTILGHHRTAHDPTCHLPCRAAEDHPCIVSLESEPSWHRPMLPSTPVPSTHMCQWSSPGLAHHPSGCPSFTCLTSRPSFMRMIA